jgi:uncharacterized membrane protein
MKTAITIVMTLVLATVYGCQSSSPRGGSVLKDEGFKIAVPTFTTEIKQGEVQNVAISLERGAYFKQDVRFLIKTAKGISVEPTDVIVKASDQPDVQLRITVPKNAALGVYHVSVKGTPAKTGEPTSTEFDVRVVTP